MISPLPPYKRPRPLCRQLSQSHTAYPRTPSDSSMQLDLDAPLPAHLLTSPATAAAQMLNIDLDNLSMSVSEELSEEWVSQRSREELSRLLLEAEKKIKDRERELGLAASIGKTLLEKNKSLRIKHEALLSRIPASPPDRTPVPAIHSPSLDFGDAGWQSDDEPYASTSASVSSLVPSISTSSQFFTPRSARRTRNSHTRVPSAASSPQALALLSDQNASLQQQIEQLEVETSRADRIGRRKLHKLEMELESLKSELEDTRERNGELEEKVRRERERERMGEGKRMRKEWAEVRAARGGVGKERKEEGTIRQRPRVELLWPGGAEDGETSSLSGKEPEPEPDPTSGEQAHEAVCDASTRPRLVSHDSQASIASTAYLSAPSSPSASVSLPSLPSFRMPSDTPTRNHSRTVSADELQLVAQLLAKVGELERANSDMVRQRAETEARLQRLGRQAEEMEEVYEEIEAEGEVDVSTLEVERIVEVDMDTVRPDFLRSNKGKRKALPRGFMFPPRPSAPDTPTTIIPAPKSVASPTPSTRRRRLSSLPSPHTSPTKRIRRPRSALPLHLPPASPFEPRVRRPRSAIPFDRHSEHAESDTSEEDVFDAYSSGRGFDAALENLSGLMAKMAEVKSLGEELGGRWEGGGGAGLGLALGTGTGMGLEQSLRATTPPQVDPAPAQESENEEEEDADAPGRETILRLGALRSAPAETFDLLYRAIEQRQVRWADEGDGDGDGDEARGGRAMDALWAVRRGFFALLVPADDGADDIWAGDSDSHDEDEAVPAPDRAQALVLQPPPVPRVVGDVWLTFLFVWTVIVFVVAAAKRGPAALLQHPLEGEGRRRIER